MNTRKKGSEIMKKTVVHVHQKFYPYQGGSTHRLLNQLMKINKENFNLIVISQKLNNEPDEEIYEGIRIIRYKKFHEIIKILIKINRVYKIDIIHSHNYRPSLYASIARVLLNKPFIVEMHSMYKTKRKLSSIIGMKILKSANKIIVLSNESKRIINEEYQINNLVEVEVIYNGIDINEFRNSDSIIDLDDTKLLNFITETKNKEKTLFGYVGSIRDFQGIDNIIKIINSVNNNLTSFLLVGGDSEDVNELKLKIQKNKNNTYIREFVDKSKVKKIYKNIDILLMPRPHTHATNSAIPLKPIEAIAAGKTILATDVKGMRELAEIINSNKILFMSVEEMIKRINDNHIKINTNDKNEDLSLFDINKQAKRLEEIYNNL